MSSKVKIKSNFNHLKEVIMKGSMRIIRVIVLAILALSAAVSAADPAGAASFTPNRPIEFVIFASPGGGSSIFGETVGGIMEKEKLVPVAVPRVYKPGGSQAVGMAYLHEKKGTPYYFGSTSNSYVLAGLTGASKTITHKNFTDIAILAFDEMVLVARQESPYKTFKDLITAAKAKPKGIKWGGSNVGGSDSILAAMIGKATGVQFNYIAFQGGGEVNAALLGGHIDVASANPTEVMPQLEGKTMRALALAAEGRLSGLKDVPTLKELGIDVTFSTFRGINAPPGISDDARAYYQNVARKVMETAAFKKYIADNFMTAKFLDGVQTRAFYDSFAERTGPILREFGVVKK
ncbi:MAG: tripartite tricarboxylate transporter substrate binding protein [Deltaproteobacteria bacterium]|nr:tripartite tricarboxylate transporter substrate binding protein [Deltaproteobacteria bacterium]